MLTDKLKLVIWDLDETFWRGTLTEGQVEIPPEHARIVTILAERGIVSSISSKNNFNDVKSVLEDAGLWYYFVFPHIEFAPKGTSISELIERMNLRPDNVLFIDDNNLNLQEARFFAPALMVAHPDDILPNILDSPYAQGKSDPALSRLLQYKQLETKFCDQQIASGSNEEFLRGCNITLSIDTNFDANMDRVIDLVNRSNQLNFTKKRLETDDAIAAFKKQLTSYGYHAGVVSVSDKYGVYGIVGFYMTARFAGSYSLVHFVFSCRVMNMGIEQYVYERLNKPRLKVVEPVASTLNAFSTIDWINKHTVASVAVSNFSDEKLLLVGGCDLLQVGTYCSSNRTEFVNSMNRGVMIRYDDPGFVLSAREKIFTSNVFPRIPCWTSDDVVAFDRALTQSGVIIISMWEAMNGHYMILDNDILVRVDSRWLGKCLGRPGDGPYLDAVQMYYPNIDQKLELISRSFERIFNRSAARKLFVLSAPLRRAWGANLAERSRFNIMAQAVCASCDLAEFVSLDDVIPEAEIIDTQHFTRKGYFALASDLNNRLKIIRDVRDNRSHAVNVGDCCQSA